MLLNWQTVREDPAYTACMLTCLLSRLESWKVPILQSSATGKHPLHAGDLDKLLGSRLKSVRPAAEVRQTQEGTDSPVATLRGQLRRVKLEEGMQASSPPLKEPHGSLGSLAGASTSQVACSHMPPGRHEVMLEHRVVNRMQCTHVCVA